MNLQGQFKSYLAQREALDARRDEQFRKTFEQEWNPDDLDELGVIFSRDTSDFFAQFSFQNVGFIVRAANWHKVEDNKPFMEATWVPTIWKASGYPIPPNQQIRIESKDDIKRGELKGYVLQTCVVATIHARYTSAL